MQTIVIGGCPGSGKTSASKLLAEAIPNSVLIETDHFFEYLSDPINPSTAARSQNETVISAYCEAANIYRKGGCQVILEGVIGP
ncbi:MAG: uridine kinase [Flavobacterium sp.]|jgi:uridine kinase